MNSISSVFGVVLAVTISNGGTLAAGDQLVALFLTIAVAGGGIVGVMSHTDGKSERK